MNSKQKSKGIPGADPSIVSYNASAVKIYNTIISLVCFENKINFYKLEKTLHSTTTLSFRL
jgi:hypothetical protein